MVAARTLQGSRHLQCWKSQPLAIPGPRGIYPCDALEQPWLVPGGAWVPFLSKLALMSPQRGFSARHEYGSNPPNKRRVTARRPIAAKAVKPVRIAEGAIVSPIDAADTRLIKRLTSECEQIGQILAIRLR